jgi:hypothetical protein
MLRLLPAVQAIAQHHLVRHIDRLEPKVSDLEEMVLRQLLEDDAYLVALLDSQAEAPLATAFAVECFRDDLHWLGTQVALLDGSRGIDFLGRVMLEEEALERELDAWENEPAGSSAKRESPLGAASVADELRPEARRLRRIALARQADSLLAQALPTDAESWRAAWQAASRLAMRLGPEPAAGDALPKADGRAAEPADVLPAALHRRVLSLRGQAAGRWSESVAAAPRDEVQPIREVADDLVDAANESLTFLEDLPLEDAVRCLEIIGEDVATCLEAVETRSGPAVPAIRRRLRHSRATLAGELQERRLAWRMERIFGHALVAGLERLILLLLVLFCVMLVAEGPLLRYEETHWSAQGGAAKSRLVETVFAWVDLGICLVFLAEFSLKMGLADRRLLYFKRNWITGLVPSIPLGFLAYATNFMAIAQTADWFVSLRALRYLRLPRMARWLRIARPIVRMARLVGFMLRASDRLVRQLAPILNRNLLLFERADVAIAEPAYRGALAALRERFYYRAAETINWLPASARAGFVRTRIGDLAAMLSTPTAKKGSGPICRNGPEGVSRRLDPSSFSPRQESSTAREIPLEWIVARLLAATPATISDRIGRHLAQSVARWCRAFDLFGIRRLPGVRELVSASRLPSPYDTTAVVANRIGLWMSHLMDRVHWVGDLFGIVTAPQLVDSIGEYLVKGTARPARRLVIIGLAFLVVSALARHLGLSRLDFLTEKLESLFGRPLIVLGGICLLIFGVGRWFRQIAGEATEFYTRVAEAQFITATSRLKRRLAPRQLDFLLSRAIQPESEMAAEDAALEKEGGGEPAERIAVAQTAVDLLWQDYLESAPFHQSDTRITTQLLGNLTLVSLRETRLRYDARRKKRVERLDLSSSRASLKGPYLWFHFISRSLAQQTAKLVENYNAHALPLSRAATAEDEKVERYARWLAGRLGKDVGETPLAPEFRRRLETLSTAGGWPRTGGERRERRYQGNDFTAIHFLSADRALEADVRRRYGDAVADLMRRDRRNNIRRVFCTYPWNRRPKELRTINPFSIYGRHFAGGRMLLLPLKTVWWAAVLLARSIRLLARIVGEVLHPKVGDLSAGLADDPFEVARRKIHRMRKPLFMECLTMRADFDPEYLGIVPPGSGTNVREAAVVQIEEDLTQIHAAPGVRRHFRRLAAQRRRQMIEFRRWLDDLGLSGLSSEALRAMAIAYAIDYRQVRRKLEAVRVLGDAFDDAAALPTAARKRPARSPASIACRFRYGGKLERLFDLPAFRKYDEPARVACGRLVTQRRGTLLAALRQLVGKAASGDDPLDAAREALLGVGRDPETWSRQLVTLRAVQTLSVLDLSTYCDLVAELGEYENRDAETPSAKG